MSNVEISSFKTAVVWQCIPPRVSRRYHMHRTNNLSITMDKKIFLLGVGAVAVMCFGQQTRV